MPQNTPYRGAVLFDLDGTLVDSAADFIAVLNTLRVQDGEEPLAAEVIRNTVSDGARALTLLGYPQLQAESDIDAKRQQLLALYAQEVGCSATLFAGMADLLADLSVQNIGWGIVTNKPEFFTQILVSRLNLEPSNAVAICPEHVTKPKPDPAALLLAAEHLGLAPASCLYAGDHRRDIDAARAAGMTSIACGYGYIKADDDMHAWQADINVDTVAQLHAVVKAHFNF